MCGQIIEVKTPVSHRDYSNLIAQEDTNHFMINKTRRCFLYHNQYFQLDIYKEPCHERCAVRKIILMSFYFKFIIYIFSFFLQGMMLLETYTTLSVDELKERLPDFLNIGAEVTGDPAFSMFNLSLKEEWINNKKFCHRLSDDESIGKIIINHK